MQAYISIPDPQHTIKPYQIRNPSYRHEISIPDLHPGNRQRVISSWPVQMSGVAVCNRSYNRRGVSSPYPLVVSSASAGYIKSRSAKSSGASSPFSFRPWPAYAKPTQVVYIAGISQTGARDVHGRHMSTTRYCITPGGTASQKGILWWLHSPCSRSIRQWQVTGFSIYSYISNILHIYIMYLF